MLSEVIKQGCILSALIVGMSFQGCSEKDDKAGELLGQSQEALETGNYEEVLILLDSIDHTYPDAVEVRRKAMAIRPKAIENVTIKQLSVTDSLLAVEMSKGEALCNKLVKIDNPIEPYMIGETEKGVVFSAVAGLHSRLSPDGMLFLTVTNDKPCGAERVILISGDDRMESPIIKVDGERNQLLNGREVINFTPEESNDLSEFIIMHKNAPVTLVFEGRRGSQKMNLSEVQEQAVHQTYETSRTLINCRVLNLEKQRLEKQLAVARNQIARTLSEK